MGMLGKPGKMFDWKPHPLTTTQCSAAPMRACVRVCMMPQRREPLPFILLELACFPFFRTGPLSHTLRLQWRRSRKFEKRDARAPLAPPLAMPLVMMPLMIVTVDQILSRMVQYANMISIVHVLPSLCQWLRLEWIPWAKNENHGYFHISWI